MRGLSPGQVFVGDLREGGASIFLQPYHALLFLVSRGDCPSCRLSLAANTRSGKQGVQELFE